jgi:hypothetical protein
MKKLMLIFLCVGVVLPGCEKQYKETEAKIIDLKIENGNYKALVEYYVDDVRYTDEFAITSERIINDSITTPHPGITFSILYDPANPQENKIDFNVKIKYQESE